MFCKAHCKNVVVCSPMDVLRLKGSVSGVRSAMRDGVHLNESEMEAIADHIILKAEEHFVAKKRGPTEKAGPVDKRARYSSDGGNRGGRGNWRGNRGGWRGGRSFSGY
jgi:hypothetical protein